MSHYFIGLDIGQAHDYTALCVIEVPSNPEYNAKNPNHEKHTTPTGRPSAAKPLYHVRHLQRFPLRTPYTEIVKDVSKIMQQLPDTKLVIDQTGVGRAVYDMFKQANLHPIGITIHGGNQVLGEGNTYRVPKRDLVGVLTIAFQNGELKIADALPDAKTLVDELLNFKVAINLITAHDTYEAWREGIHDDMVLALAVAVWYAKYMKPTTVFSYPNMRRNIKKIPTLGGGQAPSLQDVLSHL